MKDEVLHNIIQRITDHYEPEIICLFGSCLAKITLLD
jgi:hypothetical protein